MTDIRAVVTIGKSQYLVSPGQEIEVDRLSQDSGTITIPEVLLAFSDKKIFVGQPYLSGVTITANILAHNQGEKIRVEKFKAKSRYHKVRGSRAKLTRIQIEKIDIREK